MIENKQLCVHLTGVVQGVGMRYFIKDLARKMGLKGYVQNLHDGRVKCVVQGETAIMDLFLLALRNAPRGRVTDLTVESLAAATEEFSEFHIRF